MIIELCFQLELFSIPTSSEMITKDELIYQIYEILILIICLNNGWIFFLSTSTRTKGIWFNIIITTIHLIIPGLLKRVQAHPYPVWVMNSRPTSLNTFLNFLIPQE